MCNSKSTSSQIVPPDDYKSIHVSEELIATPLPDGYWVEAFPYSKNDEYPDLIGYGLGFQDKPSTVRVFTNPRNATSGGWKVSDIAYLEFPVGMAYADLTGEGYNDACHFTTKEVVQVMAFPIISKSSDLKSPAPVVVYTPEYANPNDKKPGPKSWSKNVAYPTEFRLIHDVEVLPRTNGDLDMLLVSGKERIVLLWYDTIKYWGAGSVDVCRVGDDDVGYIATCETGTLHHVATVRLPGVDTDSFAVACMGAPIGKESNQGVYMYKPIDLKRALFEKIKVTGESAGRLAVSSYCASHQTDIASISYYVPGYHTGPDPSTLRINAIRGSNTKITATQLDKEVLIRIPRPSVLVQGQVLTLPFWILAGKKMSLVILPAKGTMKLDPKINALKVIYGNLTARDENNKDTVSGIAPPAHTSSTTMVSTSATITAGEQGVVFMTVEILSDSFQGPFSTMSQVVSANALPNADGISAEARNIDVPFIRVDKLGWGQETGLWNNFQFFNATGFHVYFNDDAVEKVVQIQAWTLGVGETYARFHNHPIISFCEIHYCLTNGLGSGGMRYFKDEYTDPIDVNRAHERQGTKATPIIRDNDTVSYPWHAWLASKFGEYTLPIEPPLLATDQKFDVWMAFEFPSSAFQY
ncbi:hypothetical protein BC835DRAFT_1418344 [Cytidiella melzeri]|nr:hypothetical protein BC835DRAFT_1418344 [Cytidiella melzeri]